MSRIRMIALLCFFLLGFTMNAFAEEIALPNDLIVTASESTTNPPDSSATPQILETNTEPIPTVADPIDRASMIQAAESAYEKNVQALHEKYKINEQTFAETRDAGKQRVENAKREGAAEIEAIRKQNEQKLAEFKKANENITKDIEESKKQIEEKMVMFENMWNSFKEVMGIVHEFLLKFNFIQFLSDTSENTATATGATSSATSSPSTTATGATDTTIDEPSITTPSTPISK